MVAKLGIDEELEGGYTRHQMELMSIPSEYLEEVAREYDKKIIELYAELERFQTRKKDIIAELQQRKDYTGNLKI